MHNNESIKVNEKGHLEIGGADTVELSKTFGTPLYVMDYSHIERIAYGYLSLLKTEYPDSLVCFASKAFSCKAIYKIVSSFGLGADVVSGGELFTALSGGMSADKIIFHGNNKLKNELEEAIDAGVRTVVIDSFYEIKLLNEIAKNKGIVQNVQIRVNPGIDAHTHAFVQTTRVDSKFGFSIADGAALNAIKLISEQDNLSFKGLHCHIGSQIFELKPFELAVEKITDFCVEIKKELNIIVSELNFGGGYGITYTEEDKPLKPHEYVRTIVTKLKSCLTKKKLSAPKLILEPGRSIVGEAGITLYTIGAIKDIIGVKKYLSVDGGMFDNPRYVLYQSKYDAVIANRAAEKPTETVSIAGKCCESGDILIDGIKLPEANSGDILAVLSTGAYNYSMASNYNRNLIPAVVLVKNGESEFIVRRQTYEDIASRDVLPQILGGK